MIGKLRQAMMDEKDRALQRARNVMQFTAGVLEKILRDDDDAIIASEFIGDTEEDETMNTETQETDIQRWRRETFQRASDLSNGRVTPQEAERFYDGMAWSPYPAVNRQAIYERFKDERYTYPELPIGPRRTLNNFRYSDDARIRLDAVCEIICLFEDLHRVDPSNDVETQIKKLRQRRESVMYANESPIDQLKRLAFQEAARLSSKSEKQIAKCFDQIDWQALRKDRFAEVRNLLLADLPQADWRSEPREPEARRKWHEQNAAAYDARRYAEQAQYAVEKIFENLRAEIGRLNRRNKAA